MQMPILSGIQATEIIRRELPKERQPPIVGVTANAFPEDVQKYLASGFNSVLTKPVQKNHLQKSLEAFEKRCSGSMKMMEIDS